MTAKRGNVEPIRAVLADKYPTLHLVGRNGMYTYNNHDHAIMTAMLTIKNIQAGKLVYHIWNANEHAEQHVSGKSGKQRALSSVRMAPERIKKARYNSCLGQMAQKKPAYRNAS